VGGMNAISVLIVAGLAVAVGLVLIVRGLTGSADQPASTPPILEAWRARLSEPKTVRRLGIAFGAAVLAGVFTGWPAAALLAGGVVWFAPQLMGRDTSTKTEVARTEAIASFAETGTPRSSVVRSFDSGAVLSMASRALATIPITASNPAEVVNQPTRFLLLHSTHSHRATPSANRSKSGKYAGNV